MCVYVYLCVYYHIYMMTVKTFFASFLLEDGTCVQHNILM